MTEADIKQAVHAALKEHKEEFWIAAEQHYQDHQALLKCRNREDERARRTTFVNDLMELGDDVIRDNHEFVRIIRERKDEALKIGWKLIGWRHWLYRHGYLGACGDAGKDWEVTEPPLCETCARSKACWMEGLKYEWCRGFYFKERVNK